MSKGRFMYVHPEDDTYRDMAGFVPTAQYRYMNDVVPGEIGMVQGIRMVAMVVNPDPELLAMQMEIQKDVDAWRKLYDDAEPTKLENIKALQARCAIIGHVPAVIKGPQAGEHCFYCGLKLD